MNDRSRRRMRTLRRALVHSANASPVIEMMEGRVLLSVAMVKDINIGAGDSAPSDIAGLNGVAFFAANDGIAGNELWKSDGTSGGTGRVADIRAGTQSSDPHAFTAGNNLIFFAADNGTTGTELYWSDGNTVTSVDIRPGANGSNPSDFIYLPATGRMLFNANDGTGQHLFVSNGTLAGTRQINATPFVNPVLLNNQVIFWGNDGARGTELWRTDGNTATILRDINPGFPGSGPTRMAVVNNIVYLSANDGTHGFELWNTDGTTTSFVEDINPGTTTDPFTGLTIPASSFPINFVGLNGSLYFRADDAAHGQELWTSNGVGATLVRDINPGVQDSNVVAMVAVNGHLVFRADDGPHDNEPWVSDGTATGTKLLRDVNPGASGSGMLSTTVVGDIAYFTADDGSSGEELWQTDGTPEGTVMNDINPGSGSSFPSSLANVSGALFLSASNGTNGAELWASGLPTTGRPKVKAVEGKEFSDDVYTFTIPDKIHNAGDFTAKINWGDGSTSTGRISQGSSTSKSTTFVVSGTHTYAEEGGYPIIVTVHNIKAKTDSTGAINLSRSTDDQFEGTVAIDRINSNHIYMRSNTSGKGDFSAYSTDGGVTWTSKFVGKGTDGLPASNGDPKAVFDQYGNLFVSYLSGDSKQIIILKSKDGGRTLKLLTALTAEQDADGLDQPSIAIGPGRDGVDGSLWVAFKTQGDRITIAGASVTGLDKIGSFTQETVVGSLAGNFGDVAVGPDGQVAVNWEAPAAGEGPAEIEVAIDSDGLGPKKISSPIRVTSTNVGGFRSVPAQPNRMIDAEANLGFDTSGGANRGRLYMSFTNAPNTSSANTDIYIMHSDDSGFTWDDPALISDDTKSRTQMLPSIAVDDKTGQIVVFWHDARNSTKNNATDVFLTMSSDGGETWTPNVQVNIGSSLPTSASPNEYGDYTGVAIYDGLLVPVWADNSKALGSNPALPRFDMATIAIGIAQVEDAPLHAGRRNNTAARYRTTTPFVATFTDENLNPDIKDFSARINWGDGKATKGNISRSGNTFRVKGSHVYTSLAASRTVTVTITDIGGESVSVKGVMTLTDPAPTPIAAVGADAGSAPTVQVLDPRTGSSIASFSAYDATFKGGVRVAIADVDKDGYLDVITAPGPGSGSFGQIRVFDGKSFAVFSSSIGSLVPYTDAYVDGISIATGDVNGDGAIDLIAAPGAGARKRVIVYNGTDATVLNQFFAYDSKFKGGVRVAAGDVNGDGKAEVITAPGPGAARALRVWNPATQQLVIPEIFAFGPSYTGGMNVGIGNFNGDRKVDIIAAAGDSPAINVLRGTDGKKIASFFPLGSPLTGGIRVAAFDSNADGIDELIAAPGANDAADPLRFLKNASGDVLFDVRPFGDRFNGGMFIAAAALA